MKLTISAWITLALVVGLGLFAVIIFAPAGRLDWIPGWLYFGLVIATVIINYAYLRYRNPALIEHRMRIGKGAKTWDKVWLCLFTPVFLAIYVVAGLDAVRYGWCSMPGWLWLIGFVLFCSGTALFIWSMGINPFFETTVRIQTERGHRVIDTGPYRLVRHPGYLGFLGWILSAPLLLGSWWAFVPSAVSVVGLVARTALEDRTLREELAGYAEYAGKVRFRLIPGVW